MHLVATPPSQKSLCFACSLASQDCLFQTTMPRKGGAFNQIKALGLVLLALLGNARVQAAAEEEVTALLLFKQGLTNADQVAELVTWSGDADSPCAWEGVTCEDSAVTSM